MARCANGYQFSKSQAVINTTCYMSGVWQPHVDDCTGTLDSQYSADICQKQYFSLSFVLFLIAESSLAAQMENEDTTEADGGGGVATISIMSVCLLCALIIISDVVTYAPQLLKTNKSSPNVPNKTSKMQKHREHKHPTTSGDPQTFSGHIMLAAKFDK